MIICIDAKINALATIQWVLSRFSYLVRQAIISKRHPGDEESDTIHGTDSIGSSVFFGSRTKS